MVIIIFAIRESILEMQFDNYWKRIERVIKKRRYETDFRGFDFDLLYSKQIKFTLLEKRNVVLSSLETGLRGLYYYSSVVERQEFTRKWSKFHVGNTFIFTSPAFQYSKAVVVVVAVGCTSLNYTKGVNLCPHRRRL